MNKKNSPNKVLNYKNKNKTLMDYASISLICSVVCRWYFFLLFTRHPPSPSSFSSCTPPPSKSSSDLDLTGPKFSLLTSAASSRRTSPLPSSTSSISTSPFSAISPRRKIPASKKIKTKANPWKREFWTPWIKTQNRGEYTYESKRKSGRGEEIFGESEAIIIVRHVGEHGRCKKKGLI